jgi:hypothetical protein
MVRSPTVFTTYLFPWASSRTPVSARPPYETIFFGLPTYDAIFFAFRTYDAIFSALPSYDAIFSAIPSYDAIFSDYPPYGTILIFPSPPTGLLDVAAGKQSLHQGR